MYSVKISVRNLVEFILRSGDLTTSSTGVRDAMQEGTRIHKKIQRKQRGDYQAEVMLSHSYSIGYEGEQYEITVEGRADGVYSDEEGIHVDEIKGIYRELSGMDEPVAVHRAQALCYAYIIANDQGLDHIGIRMTYCHIPTEQIRYFFEDMEFVALQDWYHDLISSYVKWVAYELNHKKLRNQSIHDLEFPFPYRPGQNDLVAGVYRSVLRKKRLYIQAPTGVGKTIATIFPVVKAMGEGLVSKVFYLTAKTITRTVAEDTIRLMKGLQFQSVTLTAKEKICILDKPKCNPANCPRAKGHFDRINDAIYEVITNELWITRECIETYAQIHQVCPFELALDISLWADAVIGDYNYAFDPTSRLKRFFSEDGQKDYVFLIDEAHNLVDRAREMYSAGLIKEEILATKKIAKKYSKKLNNALEKSNREMLTLKRKSEDIRKLDLVEMDLLVMNLLRLTTVYEQFLEEQAGPGQTVPPDQMDVLVDFYFKVRNFLSIYELVDSKYETYTDYDDGGEFRLHLRCMDPSTNLDLCFSQARCAVLFSATFLPIQYYRDQLAGRPDDYAIYAPSPFPVENRMILLGRGISTKYSRRGPALYQRIATYLTEFVQAKAGNYMFFFPSYKLMEEIYEYFLLETDRYKKQNQSVLEYELLLQQNNMTEEEREHFLSRFQEENVIGFCVMGGIFGEGIDLTGEQLIGAAIVGTGLPMVCTDNELFREYFDSHGQSGFAYAYQYPGMNKVLQAAGRVIRTMEDRGVILLLDERFMENSYQQLFPREWFPCESVDENSMKEKLTGFWQSK